MKETQITCEFIDYLVNLFLENGNGYDIQVPEPFYGSDQIATFRIWYSAVICAAMMCNASCAMSIEDGYVGFRPSNYVQRPH